MSLQMSAEPSVPSAEKALADPTLRKQLADFVRRRVPAADVDDVVQTVLLEALAAPGRPADAAELRRWVLGIARHKVVDHHRRVTREHPADIPDVETSPAPIEARELARWAEEQAGSTRDAKQTLEWMAREGEGEKLESIAAEEQVPAARVRQRVSRMRRWMKERWLAELAAVAALTAAVLLLAWWLLKKNDGPEAKPENPVPSSTSIGPEEPSPLERAQLLRRNAFEQCDKEAWRECLDGLDRAKALDLAGDEDPKVGAARAKALDALTPKQAPTATPSALPTESKDDPKSAPPKPITTSSPFDGKKSKVSPKIDPSIDSKEPSDSTPATPAPKSTAAPPPVKGKSKPTFGTGGTGKGGSK